jgi:8-oxo-dGTP pyrophosphatase MutT (NUDIX family)
MTTSYFRIRATAVIVRAGSVLLIEYHDENGIHYNLPGGGVEPNESIYEALHREVWEEAVAKVTIERLLYVGEYDPNYLHYAFGPQRSLDFLFKCDLLPDCEPCLPEMPDPMQKAVRWVKIDQLQAVKLYMPGTPAMLIDALNRPAHIDLFTLKYD